MKSVDGKQKIVFENGNWKPAVKTFQDLIVYQNLYKAQVVVLTEIIINLPVEEKYDLVDQMRRGCKSPPARIAEAFAKRYQKNQWKKSLDDTMGECYEMINHLSVCIDVYKNFIDARRCEELISIYNRSCAQLTKLKQNWQNYHDKRL
jgi:four helix bundle protein